MNGFTSSLLCSGQMNYLGGQIKKKAVYLKGYLYTSHIFDVARRFLDHGNEG